MQEHFFRKQASETAYPPELHAFTSKCSFDMATADGHRGPGPGRARAQGPGPGPRLGGCGVGWGWGGSGGGAAARPPAPAGMSMGLVIGHRLGWGAGDF